MKKPLRFNLGFLRFLAKPLLFISLLTFVLFQVNAQTPSGVIVDPCQCLSNQSYPGNGQFQADIVITATTGDNWYIAQGAVSGLYNTLSSPPPFNPIAFVTGSAGYNLSESPAGSGTFVMSGIHVDSIGFTIKLTNGVDTVSLVLLPGTCQYPNPLITGDDFVCELQASGYSVPLNVGSSYLWSLNHGGAITTSNNLSSVQITWEENNPGPHLLSVTELATNGCGVTEEMNVTIEDTIALACNDQVQISLNADCQGQLTADMFLEAPVYENDSYEISLFTLTGQALPGSIITSDLIGQQILVRVTHSCSSNYCETIMTVEDRIDPEMNCTKDTVSCYDSYTPEIIGFPVDFISPPVKTGPRSYDVLATNLCGAMTLEYHDDTILNSCLDEFASTVYRRWIGTDEAGNTSVCYDTIETTRTKLADLIYPLSWDDVAGNNPSLKSCGNWKKLANGHPHPDYTGFPSGPLCGNIEVDFTDIKLPICGENSFKILRKWFVMDWCTSEIFDTNQIIAVMDLDQPLVSTINDYELSTDSYECVADAILPTPNVYDCSGWNYTVGYKEADEFGNPPPISMPYITDSRVVQNPDGNYTLLDMSPGYTWIKYTITDLCGNATYIYFKILVLDALPPVAVCDQHTVVSLNEVGVGYANAIVFDDGSWDNCSEVTFKVRRGPNKCGVQANQWLDGLEFCCADVGNEVMVELLVTDASGFSNSCMALVEVQDKRFPTIYCPPEITVSCDYFYSDLSVFGTVVSNPDAAQAIVINDPGNPFTGQNYVWGYDGVAYDNCDVDIQLVSENENINSCGVGTITRRFSATDPQGNSRTCTQVINVVDFDPFYINQKNPNDYRDDVVWPRDYVLTGCLNGDTSPQSLPKGYNEPVIYDDDCSLVAYDYEDVVFQFVDGYCYKIVRTWTVIDWCQFDQNDPFAKGYWQYNQLIMVVDDELPKFTSGCEITPLVNQINDSNCSATITLTAEAEDNCTNTADLVWNYEIDLNNDGIFDRYGNSNSVTGNYSYGTHKIRWYVEDECGNVNSCSRLILVKDNKKPTPICYDGIVTVPMPSTGTVEIFAKSFNVCNGCASGSYDNCTPKDKLRFSYSSNVNDVSRVFSCDDIENGILDTIAIEMWVTDLAGNQEFCNTHLILQDNQDICPDVLPSQWDVAGMIYTPDNRPIADVEVSIDNNRPEFPRYAMSNSNGVYSYKDIFENQTYQLHARSDNDPMSGVSTLDLVMIQKHLLGLKQLDTPYKMIAADVNNTGSISAADLLDLRKLILGVYDELPNNDSWRFVDSNAEFSNPINPYPFDENIELSLKGHSLHNNFVGIKIGDVNNSVQLSNGEEIQNRNRNTSFFTLNDAYLKADEQVLMDVYNSDLESLSGTQFTLSFHEDVIRIEEIISGQLGISSENYSMVKVKEGLISFSWSSAKAVDIDPEVPLFSLKIKALKKSRLSEHIVINSRVTDAELYGIQDGVWTEQAVALRFNNQQQKTAYFKLYQNTPNPFSNSTTIAYYIPESTRATLSVYDLDGKLILEEVREEANGFGEFLLNMESLEFNPGLYYYKLEAGAHISTKKMILIR